MILNPNCSSLVTKIPVQTIDDAKKVLKEIENVTGWKVCVVLHDKNDIRIRKIVPIDVNKLIGYVGESTRIENGVSKKIVEKNILAPKNLVDSKGYMNYALEITNNQGFFVSLVPKRLVWCEPFLVYK